MPNDRTRQASHDISPPYHKHNRALARPGKDKEKTSQATMPVAKAQSPKDTQALYELIRGPSQKEIEDAIKESVCRVEPDQSIAE